MNTHPETSQNLTGENPGWRKKTALYLSSQNLSLFGSMLVQYAIIWHTTLTTRSGTIMTVLILASYLPQIVISLFAGVWADRYQRKLLIIAADLLIAASTLIMAVFFFLGYRELWLIFLLVGIRSAGAGIQTPAVQALLPQIVPTDRLMKVNSINSTIQPFIMIASPILSAAMLSLYNLEEIFFVDVITAILAVGLLLLLKVPTHTKAAADGKTGYLDDLKAGIAYIGQNRAIKILFIFFSFVFFLIAPVAFLTPLLVARSFGEEVWRLTANEVTFFIGSILGGLIMTAWGGFKNRFRTIGFSCVLWAVLLSGMGLSKDFSLYLFLMFLLGIPMPFWSASTVTLLQEIVKSDMQGRVFGVQQLITNTVLLVGMLVFGPAADLITVEALLIISGILMTFPGLWLFLNGRSGKILSGLAPENYELQTGD
jgi:MFS transporter, DHA3 family, macrolide efflux protein